MSAPARKANKEEAPKAPPKRCAECNFIFPDEASPRRDYRARSDGTVVCRNAPDCRARILTVELGKELNPAKPAEWLWAKYPRDRVWQQMDIRPRNWKEDGKWMPRYRLPERVFACILYHSLCYPVCKSYAVQIAHTCPLKGRTDEEPDEIVMDQWRRPVPLGVKDIARILNEGQGNAEYFNRSGAPNVSRALRHLKATGDIRIDEDGVMAIAPKLIELTFDQRRQLWEIPAALDEDETLRAVPKRYRSVLVAIRDSEHVPANICTDIEAAILSACTGFNHQLRNIRTARDSTIEQACSRGTILIPDWCKKLRPSSSLPEAPVINGHHSPPRPRDDNAGTPLNELYEAGMGDGALAKLPPKEDRPILLIAAKLTETAGPCDDEAAAQLLRACTTVAPDCQTSEILAAVEGKAALARKMDNPIGFLLTAVPKLLAGGGLARIRQAMANSKAPPGRPTLEEERQRWREILSDPNSDDQARAAAAEFLAEIDGEIAKSAGG